MFLWLPESSQTVVVCRSLAPLLSFIFYVQASAAQDEKKHWLGKKPQWIRSQTKVIRRKREESFEIGKAEKHHRFHTNIIADAIKCKLFNWLCPRRGDASASKSGKLCPKINKVELSSASLGSSVQAKSESFEKRDDVVKFVWLCEISKDSNGLSIKIFRRPRGKTATSSILTLFYS